MAGTTYSKFFWQDWAADTALIMCSPGAQALWMRLLALAAQAKPTGHVLMPSGRKPTIEELVTITRFPESSIPGWLQELQDKGVCDVTRDGVMISRRMVRDETKRRRNATGGRKSSAVTPRNETGNFTGRSNVHRVVSPATINQSPESINHQPQKPPPKLDETVGKVAKLSLALGYDPTRNRGGHRFIEDLVRLEMDGFDFELDILAAIKDRRERGSIPNDLASLAYFRKAIEAKQQSRAVAAAMEEERKAEAAKPVEIEVPAQDDSSGWTRILEGWCEDGYWLAKRGPAPTEDGCLAPPHMLAYYRKKWAAQGNKPENVIPFGRRAQS